MFLSMKNTIAIACHEARAGLKGLPLEARCRQAFRAVKGHWMVTDQNEQFQAAVAAILLETEDATERERIEYTVETMKAIAAASQGIPVDFGSVLREEIEGVPLQAWFLEETTAGL